MSSCVRQKVVLLRLGFEPLTRVASLYGIALILA
jgi:hypothetical protein